uniref:Uncharacterized protein n=1 Tax=Lactuca sativa TaxID=4236 RepID=A0A9R1W3W6_LACSA|nr:hypothetical protein LSAT_V11C300144710 [Lactuca sativa]
MREYTAKFMEKDSFVKFYVSIEERRVERYIWGIRTICAVDVAEGRKCEHNHQGEKRALGKIKWNGRNNDSKKSKSSAQELLVDQGSGVEQCTICKRLHKMRLI